MLIPSSPFGEATNPVESVPIQQSLTVASSPEIKIPWSGAPLMMSPDTVTFSPVNRSAAVGPVNAPAI